MCDSFLLYVNNIGRTTEIARFVKFKYSHIVTLKINNTYDIIILSLKNTPTIK
jgi:hypothetical protein